MNSGPTVADSTASAPLLSDPQPQPAGSTRRTVQTVLTTSMAAAVALLAVALVVRGGAAVSGQRGLDRIDLLALPALLTLTLAAVRVARWPRSIRSLRLVPRPVQAGVRLAAERSLVGAGAARSWATTHPDLTAIRLVVPTEGAEPESESESSIVVALDQPMIPELQDQTVNAHRQPWAVTGSASLDLRGKPTMVRTVARADTWWSLAEELLGEGTHWTALVELNQGHEVAPDVTLHDARPLRRGWEILIPKPAEGNGHVS